MKRTLAVIAILALNTLAAAIVSGQTINLKVSDSLLALNQKWAAAYKTTHPTADIRVSADTAAAAFVALAAKQAEVVIVPRSMRYQEAQACTAALGSRPTEAKLAVNGLAVYVNSNNPVAELNYNELYQIFHGESKNWKEFDGGKDQAISIYVLSTNAVPGELFNAEVMSGRGFAAEAHVVAGSDLLKALAADPQAIGFGALSAADGVKLMSIKRAPSSTPVLPTEDNIAKQIYPIARCVFSYSSPAAADGSSQYLDWIRGAEGQRVAREAGFYALPAASRSTP